MKSKDLTRKERMHLRWDAPRIRQEIARHVNTQPDTHPSWVTHSRLDKIILTLQGVKVEEGYVGHPSDLLNPRRPKYKSFWSFALTFVMVAFLIGTYSFMFINDSLAVSPTWFNLTGLAVGLIGIPIVFSDYKKYRNNPEAE